MLAVVIVCDPPLPNPTSLLVVLVFTGANVEMVEFGAGEGVADFRILSAFPDEGDVAGVVVAKGALDSAFGPDGDTRCSSRTLTLPFDVPEVSWCAVSTTTGCLFPRVMVCCCCLPLGPAVGTVMCCCALSLTV